MLLRGLLFVFFAMVFAVANTMADTVTLKDGHKIEGKFLGKDGDVINFESDGIKMAINASKIANLSMGADADSASVSAPAQAPQAQPEPVHHAAPEAPAVVPAGTALTIRLINQLSTAQQGAGTQFSARLEGALTVNGHVVVPEGSEVIGVIQAAEKSGRVFGHSSLMITLSQIKIDGVLKPIATNSVNAATEATGRDSAGRVLRGAALGGLIDGGHGAETGAKVGVGLAILTKGKQVVIPAGSFLEFQLRTPFTP
jgi:hypothetical protein